MNKQILGQPAWLWGVGAVVVVGGYLYFKHQAGAAGASAQGQATPSGKYSAQSTFKEWLTQHQGGPKPKPTPTPKKKKKRGK